MKLSVFVILLFVAASLKAQDIYQFKNIACNFPEINEYDNRNELGETIAKKLEQFNQVYTKTVNCGPPSYNASIEIQKPDLYYSVQKLIKHYKKCLKKQTLPEERIKNEMLDIINKCLLIFNQKTNSIEQELRGANNSKEIISIFKKIIIE